MKYLFRKTKSLGGFRLTGTKSSRRGFRLTASRRVGPLSFSTTGNINLTIAGFTIPLRRGRR